MNFPNYYTSKPSIPVTRKLNEILGSQDALISGVETSFRHFFKDLDIEKFRLKSSSEGHSKELTVEEKKEIANSNKKAIESIEELSKEVGVHPGTINIEALSTNLAHSHIVQTSSLFDSYLKQCKRELIVYLKLNDGNWFTSIDGENLSPLEQFNKNISSKISEYPEYHLAQYYRKVRNHIIHKELSVDKDRKGKNKLKDLHESLIERYGVHLQGYQLNAPNTFESLCYDDFVIFTKSIKVFNNVLIDEFNIDYKHLVEYIFQNYESEENLKLLKSDNKKYKIAKYVNKYASDTGLQKEFRDNLLNYLWDHL